MGLEAIEEIEDVAEVEAEDEAEEILVEIVISLAKLLRLRKGLTSPTLEL